MPAAMIPDRLAPDRAVLVVVDIQQRFSDLIYDMAGVLSHTQRMIRFCEAMNIPILVTEHYPQGLGHTIADIADQIPHITPLEKIHFSCCGCDEFNTALTATGRDQIILCGIETHVCLYQTAADLRRQGRQVVAVTDAVSSCSKKNRKLGLKAMAALGVQGLGTQMVMFEILERADGPRFKLVKDLLRE